MIHNYQAERKNNGRQYIFQNLFLVEFSGDKIQKNYGIELKWEHE